MQRLLMIVLLLACIGAWAQEARKPAILCLGSGGPEWALPKKLAAEQGLQFDGCDFGQLTWERLTKVNAVILFGMSRLDPNAKTDNAVQISPAGFARVQELLRRYVEAGGGLYCYGVSFVHMGDELSSRTTNQFLEPFGARVPYEMLRDEGREKRQSGGAELTYALADRIAAHPATLGVKAYWYPVGTFGYGAFSRALVLSPDWTPLIRASEQSTSLPLDPITSQLKPGGVSEVKQAAKTLIAARPFGKGRIVLNGGESTISFFGYGYSPFADRHWGRIGMEAGLGGVKSDGLTMFVASLNWLVEPSLRGGELGGYLAPPVKPFVPREIKPIVWKSAGPINGEYKYYKGVIGAMPAPGGGRGSVAEWAAAARAQGLDYLVLTPEFAKMTGEQWTQFVADCTAASGDAFMAVPALITRDDQDNHFIQCGAKAWPRPERLSKKDPARVQDHLGYWMNDANFPLRAPFRFTSGKYPTWLHSGYDTFAVRTYEGGMLVEDLPRAFMFNQEQGDRSRIITVTLLGSPAELAGVAEWTYVLHTDFLSAQFTGANISYVSSGPRVVMWSGYNLSRNTGGLPDVAGTERWRVYLKTTSDAPLKTVTIYDSTRVFRRYQVTGNSAEITFDGLHDRRYILTAVVEDVNGKRAMTGSLETQNGRMWQIFCSDRCNIMNGVLMQRDAEGRETMNPATNHVYKAGRLYFGPVAAGENLPGVDGAGGGSYLGLYLNGTLTAEGDKGEEREPVHQITRPYESGDAIIFDTAILKRSTAPGWQIYAHAPYVDLVEPHITARLVQHHFYRNPVTPTAVIGEVSLTITDPDGVQMKKGWNGFSARFTHAWGKPVPYIVFHADGTREAGPSADEKTGTRWVGTLQPGESIFIPSWGEGFFVLDQPLAVVLECVPSRGWFRLYTGRFDTPKLAKGDTLTSRVLAVKLSETGAPAVTAWLAFRDAYGVAGKAPAYTITLTQGTVVDTRYLLELAAKDGGVTGTFSKTALPNVLPVKVTGLNDKWTAGVVDLEHPTWRPLGIRDGIGYATLDLRDGAHRYYLGNLVACDHQDVEVTLLPHNADGITAVEVHNPTEKPVTVTVRVPVATFLADKQAVTLTVPAGATTRMNLK